MDSKALCRIGVFYDGSHFARAQKYFYHERDVGWLRFGPFHGLVERFIAQTEQGFSAYKVVYAGWFQGISTSPKLTEEQLRFDRNLSHDLMHAGIEAKFLPMSESQGEKGVDVAMTVDALQTGLDGKIDIAVLVTGDGDFVPLVRALMKNGVRVAAAYFEFQERDGRKSYINERLLNVANYALNVNGLEANKDFKTMFAGMFRKVDH